MGTLIDYIRELRIKHWVKNLFLFAAPFFGGSLFRDEVLHLAIPAFLSFSLCASGVYVINDIIDTENDRLHPEKKKRPVASGNITKKTATLYAVFLFLISFALSFPVNGFFIYYLVLYIIIQILYSFYLKHIAIADIFCIASGFVIRVLAGGAAFNVDISRWLIITMFMISLVLATGKRIGEIKLLSDIAEAHRKSLYVYSMPVLNEILLITAAASLIAYAVYTVEQFKNLIYTVPFVTFGLFRYIILSKQGLGDPTDAMTKDKWLASTVILWLLMIVFIRYN